MAYTLVRVPTRAQKAGIVAAIAICIACPRPALAQTPRAWDAFAGYSYLRNSTEDLSLPIGWAASAAFPLHRWFSIVADTGGNYRTLTLVGGDVRVTAHAVMAGGRASIAIGKLVEFVQIVAGPVHTSGTAFGLANSDTHVAAQGGIGLDVPLRPRLVGRIQFDSRFLQPGREYRAMVGIAYVSR